MAGAKAALTQGSYSFTITLVLALLIEWLFKALKHMRFHLSLVGTIACSLLYTSSWGINYLTGTPNIFLTILPGAAVSTVYTVMYIVTLSKLSQHR